MLNKHQYSHINTICAKQCAMTDNIFVQQNFGLLAKCRPVFASPNATLLNQVCINPDAGCVSIQPGYDMHVFRLTALNVEYT